MDRKKNLCLSFLLGFSIMTSGLIAQNHTPQWEEAKAITGNFKAVVSQPDIEVFSAPNIIMVKINHGTEVRIYTILGKIISAQRLEPGIFQYHLDSHGIYIVKTEETSCKIAI